MGFLGSGSQTLFESEFRDLGLVLCEMEVGT